MSLTARALSVPGCARSLDFVAGQVPEISRSGSLLPDREDLGDLIEFLGLLDSGVAAERFDHRETLVARRRPAAPLRFQPVQEPQDPWAVDV